MSTIYAANRAMLAQGAAPLSEDWWNGVYDPLIATVARYCRNRGIAPSYWDDVVSGTIDRMKQVRWDETDANVTIVVRYQIAATIASLQMQDSRRMKREARALHDQPPQHQDPTNTWIDNIDSERLLSRIPEPERTWLRSRMDGFAWTTIALEANLPRTTLYQRVVRQVEKVIEIANAST